MMCFRKLLMPALVAVAGFGLPFGEAAGRDLTVISWGGAYQDAQRQIYFQPFTAETGIPLVEDAWNGGVGVLRAKVEGGALDWDVVQVETEELVIGCEEGLYERLDYSRIGAKEDFIDGAAKECGLGTIVWSTALAYDRDRLKEGPTGWADFFDTAKFPGKRGLRRGPKYALEFALIGDGVPVNEVYEVLATPEGVDRAFAKLDTIKNDIVWWEPGAQPPQLLASGEVVMTSAYNGRISAANKTDGRNFGIVWPGSLYAIDYWVILRGSPNVDPAHKFIAFASDPKRQAQLPEHIAYGVTHRAAVEAIPPEQLADLPTAPKNLEGAAELSTEFWIDNLERLTERFNSWVAQ